MKSRTKLGIMTIFILFALVALSRLLLSSGSGGSLSIPKLDFTKTFNFEFKSQGLRDAVQKNVSGTSGQFAVYIENLNDGEKYTLNELEPFPAASLYKLILLAAVLKEVEEESLTVDEKMFATKTHLSAVLGGVDFGYEEAPENISYSVEEALVRVGRISDNFAAIMLAEKLKAARLAKTTSEDNRLLVKMAKELEMLDTSFETDPITTTAFDIAVFFKKLYQNQVVSPQASQKIVELLSLSKINDRLPAKLPQGVRAVHKTGELSRIRHDAGIIYLESKPYVIVLLSKELEYEDDGVEVLANISKDVYEYFAQKN